MELTIENKVMDLVLQQKCCAQIIMLIGLEARQSKNVELVQAMKGLCYGLHSQYDCGALSGGACLLALFNETYAPLTNKELVTWFKGKYGSVRCEDIIGQGYKMSDKCLKIISETCEQCFEILQRNNLLEEE
jgi:hypothetical protein